MADGKLCILAIGNSFSQDAVEQYLWELFDAAGIKAVIGNMYIGGCTLETHWSHAQSGAGAYAYRKVIDGTKTERANVALPTALADEDWDIVTLQQASGNSGRYETYVPYLGNLLGYLADKVERPVWFHQTWAYAQNSNHDAFPRYDKDQMTMYNAIMSAVRQAFADNPSLAGVIPSGTAVQNARTSFLGDTFNRDGYHLETTYGRYTAACTWFEALSGKSVVGNTYAPATIDAQSKAIAQNAAHMAVANPYAVTDMVDFKKPQITEGPLAAPLCIDFGSRTVNATWNNITSTDATDITLKDTEGRYTSATLSISPAFSDLFAGAGSEPDSEIVSGGITWPKSVWADSFVVSGTAGEGDSQTVTITVAGLDAAQKLDVTVLATRYNGTRTARTTQFDLTGSEKRGGQIKQGIRIGTSAGQYPSWSEVPFEEYTLTFDGMSPAQDGTLRLGVKGLDVGSTVVQGNISALRIAPAK
ncbi:MAG: DUF4886 domain-containing protein [Alistipes sp.]|nr:DUF4886 domain-containing protein [Alistipes sp.]